MAIYTYKCHHCNNTEDISKKMSESDRVEHCSKCGEIMERTIESYVCGASINKCGGFYRSVN